MNDLMQNGNAIAVNKDMLYFTYDNYDGPGWLEEFSRTFAGHFENHHYILDARIGNGNIHAGKVFAEVSYLFLNCTFNKDITFSFNQCDSSKGILLYNPQNIGAVDELPVENSKRGYMRFLQGMYYADSSGEKTFSFHKGTTIQLLAIFFDCEWFKNNFGKQTDNQFDFAATCSRKGGAFIHQILSHDQRMQLQELFQRNGSDVFPVLSEHAKVLSLCDAGLKKVIETASIVEYAKISAEEKEALLQVEKLLLRTFSEPPPTIKELARIVCMSETSFKIKFKRMFGMNVYEYFQHFRLNRAKQLLEMKQYSIKEVGYRIGYTNMSHFSRNFKNKFGMLPSAI